MQGTKSTRKEVICWKRVTHKLLVGCLAGCSVGLFKPVAAQITPDGTLGAERSIVTPNVNINGLVSDQISGGAIRGQNLLHSFREFNVQDGRGAYFSNPQTIKNILSRVTGKNPSDILGTLGVLGDASLYFINPNGIVFGPNASLDVRGSFVASTADSIRFEGGAEFSAVDPQAPPLLTINIPVGLQFRETQDVGIIHNSGVLAAGQDLKLSAGKVDSQGQVYAGQDLTIEAEDTVTVRDSTTNPSVAVAGKDLLIQGKEQVDILALNHPSSGLFSRGDMVLRSGAPVGGDAHFWAGGDFRIERWDGRLGDLSSRYDPIIRSQGDVSFFGYQGSSLHILAGGSVDINTAVITGTDTLADTINPTATPMLANVRLSDGTDITIDGNARPTLDVRAGMDPVAIGTPLGTFGDGPEDIFFDSSFFIVQPSTNDSTLTSASIILGDILIDPPGGLVYLTNQYEPNPSLPGGEILVAGAGSLIRAEVLVNGIDARGIEGDGSDVILDSRDDITLAGSFIDTSSMFSGNSADIRLLASGDISLTDGAFIDSSTLGEGDAGRVVIAADNSIIFDGASILSRVREGAIGRSKGIEVKSGSLSVLNGSQLDSRTEAKKERGDAGAVVITSDGHVLFDRSGILTNVRTGAVGNSGAIEISADSLEVTNGARFSTTTFGEGNAGRVAINARDQVSFDGSAKIFSQVQSTATGNSGGIEIIADSVEIANGASLDSATLGRGRAGRVTIMAHESVIFDRSSVSSRVRAGAMGSSGGIEIDTGSLSVTNGSRLSATSSGQGNAGALTITVKDKVLFDRSNVASQISSSMATGEPGSIKIDAGSLELINGATLSTSTFGLGDAGIVEIVARDSVVLNGPSGLFSRVGEEAVGDSDGIRITTDSLLVTNGAQIDTRALSKNGGDAGAVVITADGHVLFDRSGILTNVRTGAVGNSGAIEISADSLEVTNESQLDTTVFGKGEGGRVAINVKDAVVFDGSAKVFSRVGANAEGNSGGIEIDAATLEVKNGAGLDSATLGVGNAGRVFITARESVLFDRSGAASSRVRAGAKGNSKGIEITTGSFYATGGTLTSTTEGQGSAGPIVITASDNALLDGSDVFSQVARTTAVGDSAGITISAGSVELVNGALVSATSRGTGNSGPVIITAGDEILLDGSSLFSQIASPTAVGDSGGITIDTGSLEVINGAQLSATTVGKGNAGRVAITARDSVIFDGRSGAFSRVEKEAVGSSEGIEIKAGSVSLYNDAQLSTRTEAIEKGGDAGDVVITAEGNILIDGESNVLTSVRTGALGDSGAIEISADSLVVTNGSRLSTTTFGEGDAGRVTITARNAVVFDGSGEVFSQVQSTAIGDSGGIEIKTGSLNVANGAVISGTTRGVGDAGSVTINAKGDILIDDAEVSAISTGDGTPGNIQITTGKDLHLDNQAVITSETLQGEGNITLRPRDLVIRRESQVSTNATGPASGGNIQIATDNLVALENSDITANSEEALGGRVAVKAEGIFGTQFRDRQTPKSDITATSALGPEFSGIVETEITAPDPTRGLVELPEAVVDPAAQIAQHPCTQGLDSEFIVTGRGGLSPSPTRVLSSDASQARWVEPASPRETEHRVSARHSGRPDAGASDFNYIVPARGWTRNEEGEVILVAYNTRHTGLQRQSRTPSGCHIE